MRIKQTEHTAHTIVVLSIQEVRLITLSDYLRISPAASNDSMTGKRYGQAISICQPQHVLDVENLTQLRAFGFLITSFFYMVKGPAADATDAPQP